MSEKIEPKEYHSYGQFTGFYTVIAPKEDPDLEATIFTHQKYPPGVVGHQTTPEDEEISEIRISVRRASKLGRHQTNWLQEFMDMSIAVTAWLRENTQPPNPRIMFDNSKIKRSKPSHTSRT